MNQPSLIGFDWTSLDPDTREIVRATTERLHELERRTGEAIIEIGRGLIDTKQRLAHGQFGAWLEAEFSWSDRTARRFMAVAETFGDKIGHGVRIEAKALYVLSQGGEIPEALRDEVIARANAGERITHRDVKERIAQERQHLAIVDLDSGEIIESATTEPEEIDEPLSIHPPRGHSMNLLPPPVSPREQAYGEDIGQEPPSHPLPSVTVDQIAAKNPSVERARMRRLYTTAVEQALNNLIPLKPAAVVASLTESDTHMTRQFLASVRRWCDEVDAEMQSGIRIIHRKDA